MPFDVRSDEVTLETTIPQQTLSDLGETLVEAIEGGYYDTPRRITPVDSWRTRVSQDRPAVISSTAQRKGCGKLSNVEHDAKANIVASSDC